MGLAVFFNKVLPGRKQEDARADISHCLGGDIFTLVNIGDALTECHGMQVHHLLEDMASTCKTKTKQLGLSEGDQYELTERALVGIVTALVRRRQQSL